MRADGPTPKYPGCGCWSIICWAARFRVYLPIWTFQGAGRAWMIWGSKKTTAVMVVIAPAVCRISVPSPSPAQAITAR